MSPTMISIICLVGLVILACKAWKWVLGGIVLLMVLQSVGKASERPEWEHEYCVVKSNNYLYTTVEHVTPQGAMFAAKAMIFTCRNSMQVDWSTFQQVHDRVVKLPNGKFLMQFKIKQRGKSCK